jgi:hypothetical protein
MASTRDARVRQQVTHQDGIHGLGVGNSRRTALAWSSLNRDAEVVRI